MLQFHCRPWFSLISKIDGTRNAVAWNALGDQYIASGKDNRGRVRIENVAKIGPSGGPLHRRCEGPECPSLEDRDGIIIQVCSGCKKASRLDPSLSTDDC